MKIDFEGLTVNGGLRFEEMPLDVFIALYDFLQRDDIGQEVVSGAAETADGVPEAAACESGRTDKTDDPWAKCRNYKGKEKVRRIFDDAQNNPDIYEWQWMTSRDWYGRYAEFKDVEFASVALMLGDLRKHGIVQHTTKKDPENSLDENYYLLPILNQAETDSIGSRIRHARKERRYSVSELAGAMGYPCEVLYGWESGRLMPSSEAIENLEIMFGDDLFDGVEI